MRQWRRMVEVTDFARRRMLRHPDLTEELIEDIIRNHSNTYRAGTATVYARTLDNGQIAKVRIDEGKVIDTFITKS